VTNAVRRGIFPSAHAAPIESERDMSDLVLAVLHHLLVFSLAGLLAAELALLRPGVGGATLKVLGGLDAAYGATATLILAVGFSRVYFGVKGSAFYLGNPVFWAKIGAFAVVGLLSIAPTITILRWRKRAKAEADFAPSAGEVAKVRRVMVLEVLVFALIPILAAAMARGYGL
jgi:putative membrane protein